MLKFNPLSRIYTQFSPLGRRYLGANRAVFRTTLRNQSTSSTAKSAKSAIGETGASAGTSGGAPKKPTGIKALVKEYGYSALAIYFGLSMIDLPIIYVLVHASGKEQIEIYENKAKQVFGYGMSDEELKKKQEIDRIQEDIDAANSPDAQAGASKDEQSIVSYVISQFSWTEFAIAYGLHKSLIFIRLPITAAITPGVVRVLRRWGFKIGSDKLSTTASLAKDTLRGGIADVTASSAKFGVRADKRKKWFYFF